MLGIGLIRLILGFGLNILVSFPSKTIHVYSSIDRVTSSPEGRRTRRSDLGQRLPITAAVSPALEDSIRHALETERNYRREKVTRTRPQKRQKVGEVYGPRNESRLWIQQATIGNESLVTGLPNRF